MHFSNRIVILERLDGYFTHDLSTEQRINLDVSYCEKDLKVTCIRYELSILEKVKRRTSKIPTKLKDLRCEDRLKIWGLYRLHLIQT